MNKILRNILSIAVVSASLASCSQVDMVSEEELVEYALKKFRAAVSKSNIKILGYDIDFPK